MIYTFTKERIVNYHKLLINKFGGIHGYNNDILEAVIYQPYITIDRKDIYKTNIEKVCRLAYGLVARHPFVDGNSELAF